MTSIEDRAECERRCWQIAAAAGIGLFLLLWAFAPLGFLKPVLFGIFAFAGVGLGLIYTRCPSVTPAAKPVKAAEAPPRVEAPKPAAEARPDAQAAPDPAAASKAEAAPEQQARKPEAVAAGYGLVKPSAALPGQGELAARKGSWRYAAPAAAPAGAPARLGGPRDGKADDLRKIKGIGPKLEQLLNGMGFYHFDQIAAWGEAEVAWVDRNLEGFKGRVSRDGWVAQAAALAGGAG